MSGRVYWASIVLDSVWEHGSPWVLYVNARPVVGEVPLAVDGPLRLRDALRDLQAQQTAEAALRELSWVPATSWEKRIRGWVCWLHSADIDDGARTEQLHLHTDSNRSAPVVRSPHPA